MSNGVLVGISKMMRGFQIWPHNSNMITFDPLFGQKTVENRDIFKSLFSTVFGPKRRSSEYQGWDGSRAGGFEAEAEAMTVIGSPDRSRSQWLRF